MSRRGIYYVDGVAYQITVKGREYFVYQAAGLSAGDEVAWGIADPGVDPTQAAIAGLNRSKQTIKKPWPKDLVTRDR
jgi:hypothetical protein